MSSLIERLKGEGRVLSGQRFVADVRYDIRVYQDYEEVQLLEGPITRTPTSRSVQLNISPAIGAGFGERLTLHMSDGRKLDFFLASSGGDCMATGGFY
jgi:hypothetical protein